MQKVNPNQWPEPMQKALKAAKERHALGDLNDQQLALVTQLLQVMADLASKLP